MLKKKFILTIHKKIFDSLNRCFTTEDAVSEKKNNVDLTKLQLTFFVKCFHKPVVLKLIRNTSLCIVCPTQLKTVIIRNKYRCSCWLLCSLFNIALNFIDNHPACCKFLCLTLQSEEVRTTRGWKTIPKKFDTWLTPFHSVASYTDAVIYKKC